MMLSGNSVFWIFELTCPSRFSDPLGFASRRAIAFASSLSQVFGGGAAMPCKHRPTGGIQGHAVVIAVLVVERKVLFRSLLSTGTGAGLVLRHVPLLP